MCLDALDDRRLRRDWHCTYAFTTHGVSFRWAAVLLPLDF